jgi:hypothetical protein
MTLTGLSGLNVCVYAVRGVGGLKNVAQRNVKPDHSETLHRYAVIKKRIGIYAPTSRNYLNKVLGAVFKLNLINDVQLEWQIVILFSRRFFKVFRSDLL